jgi:membrane protease YdiL (CAAX protease family)
VSAQSIRSKARSIANFSLLQMVVAAALVAGGFVRVVRGPVTDGIGIAIGIAAGLAAYYVLAAGDASTPVAAKGNAIRKLATLLAGVSIAEELIWRGFALDALRSSTGPVVALVATTIGFAASHADTQGFTGIRYHLITGLVFGLTCLATGSLLSAVAAHLSYNMMFVRRIALQGSIAR